MIYLYDGTYEGLLSVVFETYRLKTPATVIMSEYKWEETLFDQPITVDTNLEQAKRIEAGIAKNTSRKVVKKLYRCFLSEMDNIEMLIYHYCQKVFSSEINIEHNFIDDTVLKIQQIDKMIGREVHRMHAFVRFQQTKDDIYYSVIEPDFNVLPLIIDHFEKRYPAQNWLIYDSKRFYGMFYDQQKANTEAITFDANHHNNLRQLSSHILEEKEVAYQQAWKVYFKSTNIPERRNMKLHLQHVPRRYWKYLVEK